MILLLKNVAVFIATYTYIIQFSNCFSFPCKPGQIERKNKRSETICCYTTICAPSHMFDFCQENDGFDVCKSCPEGTYHLDVINTASMPSVIDPCVSVVSCENPEVILQNGRCVCDRQQGYYGGDPHNCRLAEVQCSSPGYELKHNGKCEACDDDFFKDQSDHKVVCKAKTICSDNEEIISNGSTTEDRKCKEKLLNRMTPSKFNSDESIVTVDDDQISGNAEQRLKDEILQLKKAIKKLRKRLRRLENSYRKRNSKHKRKSKKRKLSRRTKRKNKKNN